MLPFDIDVESELPKKEEEAEQNFNENMQQIKNQSNNLQKANKNEKEVVNVAITKQIRE